MKTYIVGIVFFVLFAMGIVYLTEEFNKDLSRRLEQRRIEEMNRPDSYVKKGNNLYLKINLKGIESPIITIQGTAKDSLVCRKICIK